jgi:hypothetical protein
MGAEGGERKTLVLSVEATTLRLTGGGEGESLMSSHRKQDRGLV